MGAGGFRASAADGWRSETADGGWPSRRRRRPLPPTARRRCQSELWSEQAAEGARRIEFAKNRNQEGKARGPLKERLSGRMFSVEKTRAFVTKTTPALMRPI